MSQKSKNIKPLSGNKPLIDVPKWAIIAVLALTALIYSRALQNGFAGLDDDKYILINPLIKNFNWNNIQMIFTSFFDGNYQPFVLLTYLVEYKLFGLSPFPYHLSNVLLHLLNVLLVYKLSEQLSGKKITALVVSLLFAVHPMHVESVAWITERKDVLYTLFYLSSLLVYMNYLKSGFQRKQYIGAFLLFSASLFSKSAAATLPVVLVAIDFYYGRKINTKTLLEKIPFFILSLVFGVLAIQSQRAAGSVYDISAAFSFVERIFLLAYAISFYIVKCVAPFSLSVMHYYPQTHGALPWMYYAAFPFLLFLGWLLFRKTALRKELLFGAFFFLIVISVMLQILPVGRTITSERYSYVAYIGLFYILGQYMSAIHKTEIKNRVIAIFSLFIIVFAIQTYNRIGVWKNGEILFSDVIKKYPGSADAYRMRGLQKSNGGNPQEAIADFNIAIGLKPDKSIANDDLAETYDDRGRAYYQTGNTQLALEDYNKAIALKPEWAEANNSRGLVYSQLNDAPSAIQDFNKAIELKPDQPEPYMNRGLAYQQTGEVQPALMDFDKAILLNPDFADAYTNRCLLKIKTKDLNGALEDINKAISLKPTNGDNYGYRGIIKVMQNNNKEAIEDFNFSLQLKPKEAKVFYNRGVSRLALKDTVGACNDWRMANGLGHEKAAALLLKFDRF